MPGVFLADQSTCGGLDGANEAGRLHRGRQIEKKMAMVGLAIGLCEQATVLFDDRLGDLVDAAADLRSDGFSSILGYQNQMEPQTKHTVISPAKPGIFTQHFCLYNQVSPSNTY